MKNTFKVTAKSNSKDIEMTVTVNTKEAKQFQTITETSLMNKEHMKDGVAKLLLEEFYFSDIVIK